MKKVFLVGALALFAGVNAQTGNFKLGAHVGLPVGDAGDTTSVLIGADVAYMWPVSADLKVGVASGYSAWVGKSVTTTVFGQTFTYDVPTVSMVPVAATAQYMLAPQFSLGLDLGYGFLFTSDANDGGFYYQPKAAYHFGPSELYLGYLGLTKDGNSVSAINLGYAYTFGK
ncbi:hypothetical protein FNJ88_12735 [Chryseobacterium sp. SNU WT5]|uniref:hypothetical protein n=1 Tax=Chryseobacterium sp. SNU WT5 TaxID=2594269 RepID=UPI00117D87F0|nr:hypothetical protein [Chryseobacterium sp. SNU WT5]QDP86374.1 hypothetical protein FNJ88_12735 [Chryseobacterium sp. SNU WT5]